MSQKKTVSTASYSYDDNGNTISQLENRTQETVYNWNFENRLVKAILADGSDVSYVYDAEGIRVASQVEGVVTTYLVDSNQAYAQVLEESVNGELSVNYVYGLDLISQERGTETSIYLVDGLGSTRVLTDAQGEVVATYTYEAFGNLIESTGM